MNCMCPTRMGRTTAAQGRRAQTIYEMFLEKYGLNAGECLFIDDREDNCSGAKEAGFNTFCFKGDYQDIINHLIKERNS